MYENTSFTGGFLLLYLLSLYVSGPLGNVYSDMVLLVII